MTTPARKGINYLAARLSLLRARSTWWRRLRCPHGILSFPWFTKTNLSWLWTSRRGWRRTAFPEEKEIPWRIFWLLPVHPFVMWERADGSRVCSIGWTGTLQVSCWWPKTRIPLRVSAPSSVAARSKKNLGIGGGAGKGGRSSCFISPPRFGRGEKKENGEDGGKKEI